MDDPKTDYGREYAGIYDLITGHKDYSAEVNVLSKYIKNKCKSGNILSIGCGTGSHESLMAKQGFKVFGIDNAPEMLRLAKLKSTENCKFGSSYEEAHCFFHSPKVDCIISLFNVVNCLSDIKSLGDFFSDVRSNLSDGGGFFFEAWNGKECKIIPPQRVDREYYSDNYCIHRKAIPQIISGTDNLEIEYNISGSYEARDFNFTVSHKITLFDPEDILKELNDSGFTKVRTFSALPRMDLLNISCLEGNRMLSFYAEL